MTADLHTHTYYSDGLSSPRDLVQKAREVGLTQIAITDHDAIEGIAEAEEEGKRLGIRIIPGIELSADISGTEVHLLGYFVRYQNGAMQKSLGELKVARENRVRKIAKNLSDSGVRIRADDIFAQTGKGSVGRPHVARALIALGAARDLRDAFARFLVPGKPGYVSHDHLNGEEAIALIHAAGGVSVLAHPVTGGGEETIPELVRMGLMGLEVYYENYTLEQVRRLEKIAGENGLVKTGGSDYHGEGGRSRPVFLGSVKLEDNIVEVLEDAARSR